MYMNDEYVDNTPLDELDPENESFFKSLPEIHIGKNTEEHIEGEKPTFDVDEFRRVCRSFQVEVCKKIKEKCEFECFAYFFNKSNVFNRSFHMSKPNLDEVFDAFSQLNEVDRDTVNAEWVSITSHVFPSEVEAKLKQAKRTDHFWFILKHEYMYEDSNSHLYRNLATFVLQVLSLPNSNAACERVWSKCIVGQCQTDEHPVRVTCV